jgi:hypothetical protein
MQILLNVEERRAKGSGGVVTYGKHVLGVFV